MGSNAGCGRARARRRAPRFSRERRSTGWQPRLGSRLRVGLLALIAVALLWASAGATVSLADDPAGEAGAASAEVVLRKGDRGRAVAAVQRKLRVASDGVFGSQTHRAVKRFQRRKGLTVDGIVGPITRRGLRLRPFSRSSVVHPRRKGEGGSRPGTGLPGLPAALAQIAECESGGDPRAVSPSGLYRGKYQFLRATWKAWGGRGSDPAEASESHQDRVALRLYRARGVTPWPNCGR